VAGLLIATVGEGVCFLANAASFVAVVTSLLVLDRSALAPSPPAARAPGQLREGLRYVRGEHQLWIPLAMMGAVGCLTYEFQVSLPVMASRGLHAGATGYGFMTAAMGIGAVAGGLLVAARGETGLRPLILAACAFGIAMGLATAAPSLTLELVALALVGGASITFMSTGNSTLQLTADPAMRGRVMSLWFVAFQGSTPVGGPIVGAVMGVLGARAGLGLGAVTCIVVAFAGLLALARGTGRRASGALPPQTSVEPQHLADDTEAVDQPLHVLARVVHGERGTRRRRYAELAHQRLRAVVPGADADAAPSEDLPDIVRMRAVQRERDQRAAIRRRKRPVDH
jgi:MFS family permease